MMLTVPAVADSLAVTVTQIERAIAIGELKAARVGENGPVRIDEAEVTAYGRRGYPRIDFPTKLVDNWYSPLDRRITEYAGYLTGQVRDLMEAWAKAQPEPTTDSVAAPATPEMRALAAKKPSSLVNIKSTRPVEPHPTYLANALILHARAHAARICRQREPRQPAFRTLFHSPADFASISAEAVANAVASQISVRRSFPGKGPGIQQARTVSYSVRLGDLGAVNINQIVNAAF